MIRNLFWQWSTRTTTVRQRFGSSGSPTISPPSPGVIFWKTDRVESASWMSDTLGDTYHPLQVDAETLQKLVDALNAAPVTRPTEQEYGALSEGGKRYVQLTAADGLQIELTLFENGQVEVQGMYDDVHKCQQLLQPDDPVIQEIRNACK